MDKSNNQNYGAAKLTDINYWNNYWSSAGNLDTRAIISLRWMRGYLFQEMKDVFRSNLPISDSRVFLEIGCAPGRWIVYFRKHFGYRCYGLEISDQGYKQTVENLCAANVDARIIQADVVFSDGFLEHFTDLQSIIEKLVSLVKPGGILISSIPNLTGLHKAFIALSKKKAHIFNHHYPITAEAIRKAYESHGLRTKIFPVGSVIPKLVGHFLINKPLNVLLLGMKHLKINHLFENTAISNTYIVIGIKQDGA
ncbi:MAG: class I SAM-dependent methyltransferase [Firmicutes bacterium]|nr:class I SAM-dependent methyltransferase [Bacillota bacterium]